MEALKSAFAAWLELAYNGHMRTIEKNYRLAVRNAIKALHAAGLPAHQIRKGRLIAVYPDGHEQVLKDLPETAA